MVVVLEVCIERDCGKMMQEKGSKSKLMPRFP